MVILIMPSCPLRRHVAKKYYARIHGLVNGATVDIFNSGMTIDQNEQCLPSALEVLTVEDGISEVYVTLYEGKYHQVKRMFEAVDMKVLYLKRVQIGPIDLDDNLKVGDHRLMTKDEVDMIRNSSRDQ